MTTRLDDISFTPLSQLEVAIRKRFGESVEAALSIIKGGPGSAPPLGNQNARKHGRYSKLYPGDERGFKPGTKPLPDKGRVIPPIPEEGPHKKLPKEGMLAWGTRTVTSAALKLFDVVPKTKDGKPLNKHQAAAFRKQFVSLLLDNAINGSGDLLSASIRKLPSQITVDDLDKPTDLYPEDKKEKLELVNIAPETFDKLQQEMTKIHELAQYLDDEAREAVLHEALRAYAGKYHWEAPFDKMPGYHEKPTKLKPDWNAPRRGESAQQWGKRVLEQAWKDLARIEPLQRTSNPLLGTSSIPATAEQKQQWRKYAEERVVGIMNQDKSAPFHPYKAPLAQQQQANDVEKVIEDIAGSLKEKDRKEVLAKVQAQLQNENVIGGAGRDKGVPGPRDIEEADDDMEIFGSLVEDDGEDAPPTTGRWRKFKDETTLEWGKRVMTEEWLRIRQSPPFQRLKDPTGLTKEAQAPPTAEQEKQWREHAVKLVSHALRERDPGTVILDWVATGQLPKLQRMIDNIHNLGRSLTPQQRDAVLQEVEAMAEKVKKQDAEGERLYQEKARKEKRRTESSKENPGGLGGRRDVR